MIKKTPRLLGAFDGLRFTSVPLMVVPSHGSSVKRSSMRVSHLYPYPGY